MPLIDNEGYGKLQKNNTPAKSTVMVTLMAAAMATATATTIATNSQRNERIRGQHNKRTRRGDATTS
jgi:hypothetical protein